MSEPQVNFICLCTVCRNDIVKGDKLADHAVRDMEGDLEFFELAHLECAIRADSIRIQQGEPPYWTIGT